MEIEITAKITNKKHPHYGATVTYLRTEITKIGKALRFYNPNSGEEFYVFNSKDLKWNGEELEKYKTIGGIVPELYAG